MHKLNVFRKFFERLSITEVNRENLNDFQTEGNLQRNEHKEGNDLGHVGRKHVCYALLKIVEDKAAFSDSLGK
jgi:hypothetical protein